jgi:small subunit ribosomal protein S6
MRHLEVSFIVDPVLSGDEIKSTANTYVDLITNEGAKIIHVEDMGLNKRTTGVYYCVEFAVANPTFIPKLELALKRDERIMRFLTVSLDKYGVKYNEDKRNGKIGKKQPKLKPIEHAPKTADTIPRPIPVSTEILEEE